MHVAANVDVVVSGFPKRRMDGECLSGGYGVRIGWCYVVPAYEVGIVERSGIAGIVLYERAFFGGCLHIHDDFAAASLDIARSCAVDGAEKCIAFIGLVVVSKEVVGVYL